MMEVDGVAKVVAKTFEDTFVDLTACDPLLPPTVREILAEDGGLERVAGAMVTGMKKGPFVTGRLLAPITHPSKIVCIGLNYRDHAIETNAAIPTEPICFNKFPQTIVGPDDAVILPRVSNQVDFEAELVAVIGKRGRRIPRSAAWDYVAGYTIGNDISARDWQKGRPGGQWLLGKSADTFAPIGPYFVTADEVGDPHQLGIAFRLNGQVMQNSRTSELIFPIDQLISYLSQIFTFEPGDLLFTGTPAGVGVARTPPVFLQPGDQMEVEIEGLGVLRNPVVADADAATRS